MKKKVELLLNQLITLDEEDVTVQVSQEQFDEYNKLKQALQEIKAIIDSNTEPGIITTTGKLCEMLNGIYKKISEVESE